jgi:hypothetical protein
LKENLIEPSPTIAFVLSLYSIAWDYKQWFSQALWSRNIFTTNFRRTC